MNALTEMLIQQLRGPAVSLIGNKIGADTGTTSKALSLETTVRRSSR